MAEIVNFRRARKAKARAAAEEQAAENRARFGTSKRVRDMAGKEAEKAAITLDSHRLEGAKPRGGEESGTS